MTHNLIRGKFKTLAYLGIALLAALFFLGLGVLLMSIESSAPASSGAAWQSIVRGTPDMSQPWTPPPHHHTPPITYTLEESLLESDVVARVRLLGVEEEIRSPGANEAYGAYMEFKFEVLEYLKGGYGLSPIWGYVYLEQAEGNTEKQAHWKSKYFRERRNSQWDDREAIVLMQDIDKQNRKDHFGLGWFSPYVGEDYRAVCEYGNKKWLPAASASEVPGASDDQVFLLEYPRYGRPCDSSDSAKVVSLAELRQLATLSYAKLARRARSLEGYGHITESPQDLPPETGIYHLSARTKLERVGLSWDPVVSLSWSRIGDADSVLGHRILRRKQSDSAFIELADMPVDGDTFYEDMQDIQPETNYIYHLRAYGENDDIADARIAITTVAALEPLDAATATPVGVTGQGDAPAPSPP